MKKIRTDEEYDEWAKVLLSNFMKENPDAESVRYEMAYFLENGSANTLEEAFLKAAQSQPRGESSIP